MLRSHTKLLQEDKRFLPKKGDVCSMACEFAFACVNHKEGEVCQGFQMLNGKSARIIRHNLGENNVKYMENSYNFIQRSMDNGDIEAAQTTHKDIARLRGQPLENPKPPIKPNANQLRSFLDISDQSSKQDLPKNSEPVTRSFGSGFRAMLDACSKTHEPDALEKRDISISYSAPSKNQNRLPVKIQMSKPEPLQVKPLGFLRMVEESIRGSDAVENEGAIRKTTVYRNFRGWGFRAMLDALSSDQNDTLVVRSSAEKNLRLKKLLENVGKPKPTIERSMRRHTGFRGMLDAISSDS